MSKDDTGADGVTARLVARCLDKIPALVEETAVEQARRCLVDSLAVAVAARSERSIEMLKSATLPSGRDEASIIATGERASAEDAALVNATMISVLLYDDNHMPMRGHPSAPVLPVALALGELGQRTLGEVLAAFVAGYEVECRLGVFLNPSHYETGWHATATQGVMGATITAALLLDLDAEQTAMALGIAGSAASGLRANFGSMTMSLHSGQAASAAIRAARLAKHGFTASEDVFGGALSYGRAFSREWDAEAFAASIDSWGAPPMIVSPGPILKVYPCGRPTLPAVDCVMEIQQKHRLPIAEIEKIRCLVSFMYPRTLIHSRPVNGLQGKTSLEYCVAASFIDDGPTLASFTDEAVRRPEVRDLLERIRVEVPPEMSEDVPEVRRAPFDQPVTLVVRTRSGDVHRSTVHEHRGTPADPATDEDIRRKFETCAAGHLSPDQVGEAIGLSRDSRTGVRDLLALLQGR